MKRTYTNIGKELKYTKKEIDNAVSQVKYVDFTPLNLPMCQGECIKTVVQQCNVPLKGISLISIHGVIKNTHGFYALKVKYSNGLADVYIADNGVEPCIVASDFIENIKN